MVHLEEQLELLQTRPRIIGLTSSAGAALPETTVIDSETDSIG